MYSQLLVHLETNNILYEKQSGFSAGHRILTLLQDANDNIYKAMDELKITVSNFSDFSKAFDRISHSVMLDALSALGLCSSSRSDVKQRNWLQLEFHKVPYWGHCYYPFTYIHYCCQFYYQIKQLKKYSARKPEDEIMWFSCTVLFKLLCWIICRPQQKEPVPNSKNLKCLYSFLLQKKKKKARVSQYLIKTKWFNMESTYLFHFLCQ
ncbi:hypothetical protein PR048_028493 [Dryococelus australis]|uniref:Reverse transcriptase domain-containing protein n=1 Tax=Dryococelus australis TaxID=614101 RepID=A0ABQ9GDD3_9NEOP|nr:hypothetical protein PR048_028493 [Dryococelus australis]